MIPIDESLFLKDFKTFEHHLLPVINEERQEAGKHVLSPEQAMDHYLDLLNKHRNEADGRAGK